MNKKLKFFLLAVAALFCFVVFTYLVKKGVFNSFDFDTTVRLQNNISRRFDSILSLFSLIGDFQVISIFLIVALFLFRKIKAILILLFYIIVNFIELYAKYFIHHLPPPHFLLRTQEIVQFPQYYVQAVNSYPSGHSARTVFITVILVFLLQRAKKLSRNAKITFYFLLFTFDLIMLVSRIYLGEHWSTDVIGGAFLGFAFAIGSLIFI